MKNYLIPKNEQLRLLEVDILPKYPAKRVNIVSLKLVKENSFLYPERNVKSPEDAYMLLKQFLGRHRSRTLHCRMFRYKESAYGN